MKFKIVLTFQPIKNFKRIIPFCGLKQSFLALLPEIKHLFSVCQSNAMVYIIAPVFGVLQNGALAGFAGENIASVVGEIIYSNRGLRRVIARPFGMEFFKAQFELAFRQFGSKRARQNQLGSRPAIIRHTFPANAVL